MLLLLTLAPVPTATLDGTWTNMEQVYFDKEAGRQPPAWTGIRIRGGKWEIIDAFGTPAGITVTPPATVESDGPGRIIFRQDGRDIALRKARPFRCWMAVRKAGRDGEAPGD